MSNIMRRLKNNIYLICSILMFLAIPAPSSAKKIDESMLKEDHKSSSSEIEKEFSKKVSKLRIPFIANQGQLSHDSVSFYAKTLGATLYVTKQGEMIYSLPFLEEKSNDILDNHNIGNALSKGWVIKEHLIGNLSLTPEGTDQSSTIVNHFKGSDRSRWQKGLQTYNEIEFGEVYKGINLRLRAYGNNVEKIFTVHPGSRPEIIRLSMKGALSVNINQNGELELETELGVVKFTAPIAYQLTEKNPLNSGSGFDAREYIEVAYRLTEQGYGFKVGEFDEERPLIIDPLLASTFIGGSNTSFGDYGTSIALDSSGNVYITGYTQSIDYPFIAGAYDEIHNGSYDVFVSKLNSNLDSLIASTFIGGSNHDRGYDIALDSLGNVFITGYTLSTDYPFIAGAYDEIHNGSYDVFVSKLNSDLDSLLASTFVGGASIDYAHSIAIDSSGSTVYVTGGTAYTATAANYPTTTGAYDETHNIGYDVFVTRFNSNLTATSFASTYIGSDQNDLAYSVAFDSSNNVLVTGYTDESSVTPFPTTGGVYDEVQNGGRDVFVSKFNPDLENLIASTFIGGDGTDQAASLSVDSSDNVFVTGFTNSSTTPFPTTTGPGFAGTTDAFVSILDSDLASLQVSRFIGGPGTDRAESLAIDTSGNIYVTGYTYSSDEFSTTSGAYPNQGQSDAFVVILDSGLTIMASTCLGGLKIDSGEDIALDSSGNIYVVGDTASTNFPVKIGGYDNSYNEGFNDTFISKLSSDLTFMPPGNYYVDISQSSEGDGSPGSPWRSIHYALSEINNGSPGNYTLNVLPGDYTIASPSLEDNAPLNIGREGSVIHILGDPGGSSALVGLEDSYWNNGFSIYTSGVTIENLTIRDFYRGIYVEEASPVIKGNWIYDNDEGIYALTQNYNISPTIWNNLIYNTFENMNYGIHLVTTDYGNIYSSIYHNTINGAMYDGIYMAELYDAGGGDVEPDIRYNIITNCNNSGITQYVIMDPGSPTFSYNNVFNNTLNYGSVADPTGTNGNISIDPSYVNPYLFDFHLNGESACIDHIPPAVSDPVTEDLDGNTRYIGSGYDIGAYEFIQTSGTYNLTIDIIGEGSTNPVAGTHSYPEGSTVTITATPDMDCYFIEWFESGTTTNSTTVVIDSNITVTAVFNCQPEEPTTSDPKDEESYPSGVTGTVITMSEFVDPDNDTLVASHWITRREDSVYGRIDYDPSFDEIIVGSGVTHTISGVTDGMKYTWQVGYVDSGSGVTSWSTEYSFKVGDSVTEPMPPIYTGTEIADFCMMSFPFWCDNPKGTTVFGVDYDTRYYRIGRYDAERGGYIEVSNPSCEINPGEAYWVLAREGLDINAHGIPVTTTLDIEVKLYYNPDTLNGWNQIGCPNRAGYYWEYVEVIVYNEDGSIYDGPIAIGALADDNPYIDTRIWSWNNGSYDAHYPSDIFLMDVYEGYWVRAKAPNVYLSFTTNVDGRILALLKAKPMFARVLENGKRWVKERILFTDEAVAESTDSPPMPMGGLDDESGITGCFVSTVAD